MQWPNWVGAERTPQGKMSSSILHTSLSLASFQASQAPPEGRGVIVFKVKMIYHVGTSGIAWAVWLGICSTGVCLLAPR